MILNLFLNSADEQKLPKGQLLWGGGEGGAYSDHFHSLGAEFVGKATFTHNFSMPSSGDKGQASLLTFCVSALR